MRDAIQEQIKTLESAEMHEAKKGNFQRAIKLNAARLELMKRRQLAGFRRLVA